ncbi:MAG: hypothetical protein WCP20_17330 [Desulfuromonadales bacterium]
MRKSIYGTCMDCGSEAGQITVDEVKPVYREEVVNYTCGAVLRSMYASGGTRGSISHEGCSNVEESTSDGAPSEKNR